MLWKFTKEMNQYDNRKRIVIYLVFCMIVGCITQMGTLKADLVRAEETVSEDVTQEDENGETISMTEVYNQGNYGVSVSDVDAVTIASKEELEMFRQYVEAGNSTESVTFQQIANITMSEYTFQYDEVNQRAGFYIDTTLMGTVDVKGYTYQDYTSQNVVSFSKLGITSEEKTMWEPIGRACEFYGNYDGNGYIIEGLWSVKKEGNAGFFSELCGGTICNVTMKNSLFVGKDSVGTIAGTAGESITIRNCVAESINLTKGNCGGLVGFFGGLCMESNSAKGIFIGGENVGGCVGDMSGGEVFFCKFLGKESEVVGTMNVGGIVGNLSQSSKIHHCENYGTIGKDQFCRVGGIIGYISRESDIWECKNYGELLGWCAGGIVGMGYGNIYSCINVGSKRDKAGIKVGGIIGDVWGDAWIANCENRADILVGSSVAGIAGVTFTDNTIEIINCLNRGDLFGVDTSFLELGTSDRKVAGILICETNDSRDSLVVNCLNLGKIEAESNPFVLPTVSGSISVNMNGGSIKNCYYRQGSMQCDGTGEGEVTDSYAVTDAQIYGMEAEVKIGEKEGGYADTYSVVEALNNGVNALNDFYTDTELDGKPLIEKWIYDEMGLPIICNIGSEEMEAKPLPETPEPTPEPTPAPTLGETMEPTGTPAPMTESTSSPVPELTTMAPQESPTIPSGNVNYQTQKVTGFKAAAKAPKKVKLSWNPVENATGYEIYRSTKKKSGYKLVQTIGAKTGWTDKELKKGKKYFYKVCAVIGTGSNLVQGKMSAAKKVKLPWHTTPKVSYKKGVTPDNTRYLTIRLKKYQGTHIEILARTKKGKFKKIPLSNSQIKENHGIFGLSYTKQSGVLYCKVRTYSTTKKKKRCSLYTKVRKIRL